MFMRKIKINGEIILADDGDRLSDIFIEKAEYIDLSSDKYFADLFIENMMF